MDGVGQRGASDAALATVLSRPLRVNLGEAFEGLAGVVGEWRADAVLPFEDAEEHAASADERMCSPSAPGAALDDPLQIVGAVHDTAVGADIGDDACIVVVGLPAGGDRLVAGGQCGGPSDLRYARIGP